MIHFTLVPDIFICCQSTKKGWLDRKTRHRKKSYETLNKMFEGKKWEKGRPPQKKTQSNEQGKQRWTDKKVILFLFG